jgi:hypothetical protein
MSNASAIATTEFGAACLLEVITEFKSLVQNFQMHFNRNACAFHVEHNFTSGTRISGPLLSLHSVQMFHVDHRSQSSPPSTQTFQAERLVLWTSDSMTQAEWTRKKRRKTKKERTDPTPDPAGAVTVATRGNVPRGTFSPSERMRRGRSSWALFVIHLKPNWANERGFHVERSRTCWQEERSRGQGFRCVPRGTSSMGLLVNVRQIISGMQSHPTSPIPRPWFDDSTPAISSFRQRFIPLLTILIRLTVSKLWGPG